MHGRKTVFAGGLMRWALLAVFFTWGRAWAEEVPAASESGVEYVIESIQGPGVQVLEDGEKDWEKAVEGQVLEEGDEVTVGDGSQTTLMLQSDTEVHLDAGADLKVEQIQANSTGGFLSRLELLAGSLLADVKKELQDSHSSFEVDTNGVVCGVRGTEFEVENQGDQFQVLTQEGSVEVGSGAQAHLVEAGNLFLFHHGRLMMRRRLERAEIQRFEKWRVLRQWVWKKRLKRLRDIRNHRRKPWVRRRVRRRRIIRRDLRRIQHHPGDQGG
jgi:ferric-dicitrate binding protein FerR (iron transport regulator)